jgi:hypothetical protein
MRYVRGAETLGELEALLLRRCSQKQQFLPRTADKEKEEAMLYLCTVYDQDHWMQHHSSARFAKHLLSIASSQVIFALGHPVMSLIAIAAAITGCNEPVLAHAVPQWFPLLHVPSVPFSLSAPTLAL